MWLKFCPIIAVFAVGWALAATAVANSPVESKASQRSFSGIYPHLAYFNIEQECGTGVVVPWADRLWVITYGPHLRKGSTDKLYEIDTDLNMITRPESVGGTHANRMIHRESNQLILGLHLIDAQRKVRTISPETMVGRMTGVARHLVEPAEKVYFATMEEGFYEVDVNTLAVKELYPDAHSSGPLLLGAHGKGLYSGQGRLIFSNNGEGSVLARTQPDIEAGSLSQWDGKDWQLVRRNQFTEVMGPGGLYGNASPETDPVWSIGWDHRSLILTILDQGRWHSFRLPKSSHSYDGAHGWNTEWPRIRDIGEDHLLMTMHGAFWKFPKNFSTSELGAITPRSNYLKVIGDFARWQDQIVLGCDDAAKSEFLNKRSLKGEIAGPGRSNSNLWFISPETLDELGPTIGRGAVWLNDRVQAQERSEPFGFAGWKHRHAHLWHNNTEPVTFIFEIEPSTPEQDRSPILNITVPAGEARVVEFDSAQSGNWISVSADKNCEQATVFYAFANDDQRTTEPAALFQGIADANSRNYSTGLVRVADRDDLVLQLAASQVEAGKVTNEAYYELGADLQLNKIDAPELHQQLKQQLTVPEGVLTSDEASGIFIDEQGQRFRLPRSQADFSASAKVPQRIAREVATERDLMNAFGSFFELPARNAGGFAKLRPIATHNRQIGDYCSWRGLLVLTGIELEAGPENLPTTNQHLVYSADGQAAVWLGAIDDLWKFGKPVGMGGPWKNTSVQAGTASDAYLMTGYDRKTLTLSHDAPESVTFEIEIDPVGTGQWQRYQSLTVPAGDSVDHTFPSGFQAYWVRVISDHNCQATAWFEYN